MVSKTVSEILSIHYKTFTISSLTGQPHVELAGETTQSGSLFSSSEKQESTNSLQDGYTELVGSLVKLCFSLEHRKSTLILHP